VLNMNMRRFIRFIGVKEKPVSANPEYCWHQYYPYYANEII